MKGFFGSIAIIGLVFVGSDHPDMNVFYMVNIMAFACFAGGVAGLLREIGREE